MKRPPAGLLKSLEEAEALLASGKLNKAAQAARRAYFLAEKHLPLSHPSRRDAARMLGKLLLNLNQKSEGERLLRESGDLPASPDAAADVDQRNNEACIRVQQATVSSKTGALVESALEYARTRLAFDSDGVTIAMSNLGQLREQQGDFKAAERIFSEVLELRRGKGAEPEFMVLALLDHARIRLKCNDWRKADPLYREALKMQEASGVEGPGLAVTLNQLAHVCMRADRDEEALEHLSRSLRARRESLGEDHPQVATALHGIADMHAKMERYDQADAALQTAWFITDRSLGANHPRTVQFVTERGMVRIAQGQATLGLEHLRKAESLAAGSLPEQHPLRQQILGAIRAGLELQKRLGT